MKKYMTGGFGNNLIEEVEVTKETEKTVWVKKVFNDGLTRIDQERKDSSWHKYFDTFEDAKSNLIKHSEKKIENYKRQVAEEEEYLRRVEDFIIPEIK